MGNYSKGAGRRAMGWVIASLIALFSFQVSGEGADRKNLTIPVDEKTAAASIKVGSERRLMPGGQSVGIAIQTEGVLVIGASDVGEAESPARLAGIKSGDVIEKVDGVSVRNIRQLSKLLSKKSQLALSVRRNGNAMRIDIEPVLDERDGSYRIGVWVRDSTAGVGTLSFYDMETGYFGALGHAIADVDTGALLTIQDGGLYESSIVSITKGESGTPGELVGEFAEGSNRVGDIISNGEFGIYGEMYSSVRNPIYENGLPIGSRNEVQTGAASILTTLNDGTVRSYECEIEKVYRQDAPKQRGMVVKITDPGLLSSTGGIVQGMSGSPIIQNGKIIGAVTHVFVNDPSRGYGMYIEWMLEQLDEIEGQAAA